MSIASARGFFTKIFVLLTVAGCIPAQTYTDMNAHEMMQQGKFEEASRLQKKSLQSKEGKRPETLQDLMALWSEAGMLLMSYEAMGRYHEMIDLCKRMIERFPEDSKRMPHMSVGFIGGGSMRGMFENTIRMLAGNMYGGILRAYSSLNDFSTGDAYAQKLAVFLEENAADSSSVDNAYITYSHLFYYYFQAGQTEKAGVLLSRLEKRYRIVYDRNEKGRITAVHITPVGNPFSGPNYRHMTPQMRREQEEMHLLGVKMGILPMISLYHLKLGNLVQAEDIELERLRALERMQKFVTDQMSGPAAASMPEEERERAVGTTKANFLGQYGQILEILVKRGEKREALRRAEELAAAFEQYEPYLHMQKGWLWYTYKGMADAFRINGKHREAVYWYRKSVERVEKVRGGLMSAREKILYADSQDELYESLIASAMSAGEEALAFEYSERSRARAFLDLIGSKTMAAPTEEAKTLLAEHEQLFEELALAQAELKQQQETTGMQTAGQATSHAAPQVSVRGLQIKQQQLERLEKDIHRQYPELAATVSVDVLSADELSGLLSVEDRLVEYHVGDDTTIAFVLDSEQFKGYRLPVKRDRLSTMVRQFRNQITSQSQARELSRKLYDTLIAPLEADLDGARRLCIVPHDVLHYLPFSALHDGEGYLVERFALHHTPSANVLRYCRVKPRPEKNRLLALGNPDLGDPTLNLPYAENEVLALSHNFGDTVLLTGRDATLESFMAAAPACSRIHLAAHGEYDSANPMKSGLILAGNHGFSPNLTAERVFQLQLHADLVTLSGCQTALGKTTKGDEVIGLSRAFMFSGTPSVVSSLWKVADDSTARLMTAFYEGLSTGDKASALARAQRTIMKDDPIPFQWAAFVLIGDWK